MRTYQAVFFFACILPAWGVRSAPAAVQFEAVSTAATAGETTSLVVSTPAGTVQDDLLIALFSVDGSGSVVTPAGWTLIATDTTGGGPNNGVRIGIYSRVAGPAEPPSCVLNWLDAQQAVGAILRYSGADATGPIDVSALSPTGSGASPTAPSVTTTIADAMIVRLYAADGDNLSGTPYPAGHTGRFNFASGVGVGTASAGGADVIQAAAGATGTAAFSLTASENWLAATVAIRPASCPDDDNDGVCNADDGCPMDPNKIAPGVCGCGISDVDTDGDTVADCVDGCPADPNKIAPGICGCGVPDTDTDGDTTPDCNDGCPMDPNKIAPGVCGCGVSDVDTDGDTTPDCNDGCPNDPEQIVPGPCGCDPAMGQPSGDMTFCELFDLRQFGRVGDIVGLAVATTSWNIGDADIEWFGSPLPEHPFIAMNLYRLKDGEFEQIGQSWVKHGFFGAGDELCGSPCTYEPGHAPGDYLGMGCTDTYGSGLNANPVGMGPRYEVNPWTGGWSYTGSYFQLGGPPLDAISHRLQVHDDDLDPALNPGAQYFVEGYYAIADDSCVLNSAAWKEVTVSGSPGGTWLFGISGRATPPISGFALDAWAGASQATFAQALPPVEFVSADGRCILAGKATDLADGFWKYEYALLNVDMDRQVGSFSVPLASSAVVRNIGFHAAPHHDEAVNEPGGTPIDNSPWSDSVGPFLCLPQDPGTNAVTWSTTTNPLRWGTAYNFRFEVNSPPIPGAVITIGHFKPGTPTELSAAAIGPSPAPPDCNQNLTPDCEDIATMSSTDCNGNLVPDECGPDCDGIGEPDACVIANCTGDAACGDCNANDVPDGCDIGSISLDCNQNGTPDECEIDENSPAPGGPYYCTIDCATDCNNNGIPDECEIDENSPAPGGPFYCTADCALDCNDNGIPDECDVLGGDCNANGVPDECDGDCNGNSTADDCELPGCPGILPGDMNCSGAVGVDDLPEFVGYLLTGTPSCGADLNHDLVVDGSDAQCFIDATVGGMPCP